jgi:calcineurin-like phosphoesterase family protein
MKYWLTADEHYGHQNIIKYCNRPFNSVEEMDNALIENHNRLVGKNDTVIHIGDFTLKKTFDGVFKYINRLNGNHEFIRGSHDYWLSGINGHKEIFEMEYGKDYIVACHYAMKVWPRSHYGSYMFFGHSHGNLAVDGRSCDVGVDCNDFKPVLLDDLIDRLKSKRNFNQLNK